jgi:hypothetical protein
MQLDEDLRNVLSTQHGRRFVWRMLEVCGVYSPVFTGEPLTMSHAEGRRSVGIDLIQEAQRVSCDTYVEMVKEAMDGVLPPESEPPPEEE